MNKQLFEPITYENISELVPGEWIWDNKVETKLAHEASLYHKTFVLEPVGFRQVHILRLSDFPRFTSKPFMLSTVGYTSYNPNPYEWVIFEEGRFYRFKKEVNLY